MVEVTRIFLSKQAWVHFVFITDFSCEIIYRTEADYRDQK